MPNVIFHIDTSSTIPAPVIHQYLKLIKGAIADPWVTKATVILSDSQVRQVITGAQIAEFLAKPTFTGSGGTNHNAVFDYIKDNNLHPDFFLGLTDGHSAYPEEKPPYAVVWYMPAGSTMPPWGITLPIKDYGLIERTVAVKNPGT